MAGMGLVRSDGEGATGLVMGDNDWASATMATIIAIARSRVAQLG